MSAFYKLIRLLKISGNGSRQTEESHHNLLIVQATGSERWAPKGPCWRASQWKASSQRSSTSWVARAPPPGARFLRVSAPLLLSRLCRKPSPPPSALDPLCRGGGCRARPALSPCPARRTKAPQAGRHPRTGGHTPLPTGSGLPHAPGPRLPVHTARRGGGQSPRGPHDPRRRTKGPGPRPPPATPIARRGAAHRAPPPPPPPPRAARNGGRATKWQPGGRRGADCESPAAPSPRSDLPRGSRGRGGEQRSFPRRPRAPGRNSRGTPRPPLPPGQPCEAGRAGTSGEWGRGSGPPKPRTRPPGAPKPNVPAVSAGWAGDRAERLPSPSLLPGSGCVAGLGLRPAAVDSGTCRGPSLPKEARAPSPSSPLYPPFQKLRRATQQKARRLAGCLSPAPHSALPPAHAPGVGPRPWRAPAETVRVAYVRAPALARGGRSPSLSLSQWTGSPHPLQRFPPRVAQAHSGGLAFLGCGGGGGGIGGLSARLRSLAVGVFFFYFFFFFRVAGGGLFDEKSV